MGRQETDRPRVNVEPSTRKSKEHELQESEENKKSVARKMRHSRSSVASPSPPKKKHRLREQTTAKEVGHPAPLGVLTVNFLKGETRGPRKFQRPGVPQETPKSELQFPNRYSPPERTADEVRILSAVQRMREFLRCSMASIDFATERILHRVTRSSRSWVKGHLVWSSSVGIVQRSVLLP